MKLSGVILCVAVIFAACKQSNTSGVASSANGTAAPYMYFNEDTHDFGKVTEGEEVSYIFMVENRGKSDLVIKDVQTSCGCTVPKYEQKPISPGETGNVELVFHTRGRAGKVKKTAKVISNAQPPEKNLTITCEVLPNNSK